MTSNRDLLVGILREEEFQAGRIDTVHLDRHYPEQIGLGPGLYQNAPRAARAGRCAGRPGGPALGAEPRRCAPSRPAGATCPARTSARHVRHRRRAASWRSATGLSGQTVTATINGEPVTELLLRQATPDRVIADTGGIRREFTVRQDGGTWDATARWAAASSPSCPGFRTAVPGPPSPASSLGNAMSNGKLSL